MTGGGEGESEAERERKRKQLRLRSAFGETWSPKTYCLQG